MPDPIRPMLSRPACHITALVSCLLLSVVGTATSLQTAHADPTNYTLAVSSGVSTRYQLTPVVDAAQRLLNVQLSFDPTGDTGKIELQMPVWSPGDYHFQHHAASVAHFEAFSVNDAGTETAVPVTHPDENTWQIAAAGAQHIVVRYGLPETPAGIFSENVKLQLHYCFVNGPAALVYLVGHKDAASLLSFKLPSGWSSSVPLAPQLVAGKPVDNVYLADDYDTLADSPEVFGDSTGILVSDFQQDGTDFKLVLLRNPSRVTDLPGLIQTVKTVAKTEAALMGGMPTKHYNFIFDVDGPGGGLEHLNSFRIGLFSRANPMRFSAMIAHEFFHQWNVKRIRPAVLGPFDYIKPPRTRNLWFAEGVTEYYAQICEYRGGFATADQVLQHFRRLIGFIPNVPAMKTVTAEDASFRVWESGNSEGFGGLSYYFKGELIGLCLDLKIRAVTNGKKSLDDVMRLLMKRHAPPLPGYGEDEIRTTVNEVAGQDLSSLYNLLARTTEDLPLKELLAPFGLNSEMQPVTPPGTADEVAAQKLLREGWLEGVTK